MSSMKRCDRCDRSTGSPKRETCLRCLDRGQVRLWLTDHADSSGGSCLLASVQPHSDGAYRVKCLSRAGTTMTSSVVHALMNEAWEIEFDPVTESLKPTCGHMNCVRRDHWIVAPIRTLRTRLDDALDMLQEVTLYDVDLGDLRRRVEALLSLEGR